MSTLRTIFIDINLSGYQTLASLYDVNLFNVVEVSGGYVQIQDYLTQNSLSANEINVVSAGDSQSGVFNSRIVFVDPCVANYQQLIADIPANATIVVLDANKDGVEQIRAYLTNNTGLVDAIDVVSNIASLDVVSHGGTGDVTLGSTVLSSVNLADYQTALADIGSHLTENGDILLYGCDVASGTDGQQFIQDLATATGADVAASTDLTGSAELGGDWQLEASTGTIETVALSDLEYTALLDSAIAISNFQMSADTGTSTSDLLTKTAAQTITGTFTASKANSSQPTIYVSVDGLSQNQTVRTPATVTYTDNSGSGTFSVEVTLLSGSGKTIQFWSGASGNNPIGTAQSYTLDTTMPIAGTLAFSNLSDSGTANTPPVTADKTFDLSLSGSSDTNGIASTTYQLSTNGGGTWSTTSSSQSNLADGDYQYRVIVTDNAGNSSPSNIIQVKVDNTAPTAGTLSFSNLNDSGTANTPPVTNDNVFDLGLSGAADTNGIASTTYQVSTNGGGTWSATTSSQSNLADGDYQYRALVTDNAGNTSSSNTIEVKIDTATAAPAVVLTTDSTDGGAGHDSDKITSDGTLDVTGVETDAKVEYRLNGGAWTTSFTAVEGQNDVTVRVTDIAGNQNSTDFSFMLDTATAAPGVALTTDSTDGGAGHDSDKITSDGTLDVTGFEAGAMVEYRLNGGAWSTTFSAVEGQNDVTVRVTDIAGNQNSTDFSFMLDTATAAPGVALTTDSTDGGSGHDSDKITNVGTLDVTGFEAGAKVEYRLNGGAWSTSFTAATGQNDVTVRVTDIAGNQNSSDFSFTLDTTAPTISSIGLSDTELKIGDTSTVTITFSEAVTGFGNADVTVENGSLSALNSSDGGKTWTGTFMPTANVEDATNVVTVANTYTDAAGNAGMGLVSGNYVIDTKGPTVASISLSDTALKIGDTSIVTITFSEVVTGFGNADLTVENGSLSALNSSDGGKTWTGTFTPTANVEDATNVVTVANTYTDVAGNVGSGVTSGNYAIDTLAPTVQPITLATVENADILIPLLTDYVTETGMSLTGVGSSVSYSWATGSSLTDPVSKNTHTDLNTLLNSNQLLIAPDGQSVLVSLDDRLDWMTTGQEIIATFNYALQDSAGNTAVNTISFRVFGSSSDSGKTMNGTNGKDTLQGTADLDVAQAGNGNDSLYGYDTGKNASTTGATDTDILFGGSGNDTLYGGAGQDYLFGDSGNDMIYGGLGDDVIFGGRNNDTLTGDAGNDHFVFMDKFGIDKITDFGRSGTDTVHFIGLINPGNASAVADFMSHFTDTGNDVLLTWGDNTITFVGVQNVSDVTSHVSFIMPDA